MDGYIKYRSKSLGGEENGRTPNLRVGTDPDLSGKVFPALSE
jgi:hypothetical protein